ncbi:HD domain-containing protein [Azospirillum sp. INR13]|uniref:HD domain-containing protein n=1 Tax=Azospirillum sp. INR13 TaxID=2596919 RepID=UPI001892803C|nr:HD domain-containing protein [Azospirillum sp. INR13]
MSSLEEDVLASNETYPVEVPGLELNSAKEGESNLLAATTALTNRGADFMDAVRLAAPLILSDSFRRLRRITFLGILSPAYSNVDYHPIRFTTTRSDRSRNHHSLRVALLAGKMSEYLGFSPETTRYALAWGLLHDIATWPLSHTGEAAFSDATETSAQTLRRMMIVGDSRLHHSLCAYHAVKEMKLDVDLLLGLFDRKADLDGEASDLHKLLHSALTPDTLEGMHRSGRTFDLDVPQPFEFVDAMERDLVSGLRLKRTHSALAIRFWRMKSRIYSCYINKEETVAFESSWSAAIRDHYRNIDLSESLYANESDILRNVASRYLRPVNEVVRYKAPLIYQVAFRYRNAKKLKSSIPVDALSDVFTKARS